MQRCVGLCSYVSASVGWDQLVERDRLIEPDTEVLKYVVWAFGLTWLMAECCISFSSFTVLILCFAERVAWLDKSVKYISDGTQRTEKCKNLNIGSKCPNRSVKVFCIFAV